MPSDPSPAEDAAARTKEAEEQAALPYKWNQTIAELDVTFTVPGNFKSRDLVVEIKKQSIAAGIKGQDPIIKVRDHVFHLAPHVSQLLPNPCTRQAHVKYGASQRCRLQY